MQAVRIVLCLEAVRMARSEVRPVFALEITAHEVRGIELQALEIGIDGHPDAGLLRIRRGDETYVSVIVIEHPVMIEAVRKLQLIEIRIDIACDHLLGGEIHRGASHRLDTTVRDRNLAGRCIAVCMNPDTLLHRVAAVIAVQVEVRVVRHIEDGVLIGGRLIVDLERVVLGQGVGHGHLSVAWEALITVRGMQGEDHVAAEPGVCIIRVPDAAAPVIRTGMEIVGTVVIDGERIMLSIQIEARLTDTVRVSADRLTHVTRILKQKLRLIDTEHDIPHLSVLVTYQHRKPDGTEVRKARLRTMLIRNRISLHLAAILQCSKH